jgi:hypothetical protein
VLVRPRDEKRDRPAHTAAAHIVRTHFRPTSAAMAETLECVSIHGPTLAVLLQSVITSERACDGLLFGSVTTRRSVQAHDAHGGCPVTGRCAPARRPSSGTQT